MRKEELDWLYQRLKSHDASIKSWRKRMKESDMSEQMKKRYSTMIRTKIAQKLELQQIINHLDK